MLLIWVYVTCPYPFTYGKMLGQATSIQKDFIQYLCEKVVINYQKGGD